MSAPRAYRLENVVVRYGERVVLDVPALAIERGRTTALVGANGAGKTALLRVLALLDVPANGGLEILGRPLPANARERTLLRRDVTLVAQSPFLFRRTVAANVAFGLRARDEPADERIGAALAATGLAGFGPRPARRLSAGESQRVALARAIAIDPPILLLDEPTANVDRERVPEVERAIRRMQAAGKTIVLATHDLDQAYRLADSVVGLAEGRIVPAPPRA